MGFLGWLLLGVVLGAVAISVLGKLSSFTEEYDEGSVAAMIAAHFDPVPTSDLMISQRQFPYRVRADLQRAFDQLLADRYEITFFSGIRREYNEEATLTDCIVHSEHNPAITIPPEYEELDIGEERPVRALTNGFWLLRCKDTAFVVLLSSTSNYCEKTGMQFQVGTTIGPESTQLVEQFFAFLEQAIREMRSYRGKVLSLEQEPHQYSGTAQGIQVHRIRQVDRDQVVLPTSTLSLLDRNVINFVGQREDLARFHQSTRKGLLFYGPPGTGKTHTIHYLAEHLPDHTTLLVSAEQVGLLAEYMTLARLLQPSMIVIEDVDLIARDRAKMKSAGEEVLLNRLLNEMDGLKEDADILFVLTTNRPEALESALASRPGRIDQAIEFPLPDEEGRCKLVVLYGHGIQMDDDCLAEIVRRTSGVSAAFIKELMRRAVQYHIETESPGPLQRGSVEAALDEMLVQGGKLNLRLLGAGAIAGEADE